MIHLPYFQVENYIFFIKIDYTQEPKGCLKKHIQKYSKDFLKTQLSQIII